MRVERKADRSNRARMESIARLILKGALLTDIFIAVKNTFSTEAKRGLTTDGQVVKSNRVKLAWFRGTTRFPLQE